MELNKVLGILSNNNFSQIFFIPALKVNFFLKKFKYFYKDRKILIAKEITKLHETFYRSDINNLKLFKSTLKGELTIVISEKNNKDKVFDKEKIKNKAVKFLKKYSLRDTVDMIVETEKVNKKEVYRLCLEIKNEKIN